MKEKKKSKLIKGIVKCLIKEDFTHSEALEALEKCKVELLGARLGAARSIDKLKDVISRDYLV